MNESLPVKMRSGKRAGARQLFARRRPATDRARRHRPSPKPRHDRRCETNIARRRAHAVHHGAFQTISPSCGAGPGDGHRYFVRLLDGRDDQSRGHRYFRAAVSRPWKPSNPDRAIPLTAFSPQDPNTLGCGACQVWAGDPHQGLTLVDVLAGGEIFDRDSINPSKRNATTDTRRSSSAIVPGACNGVPFNDAAFDGLGANAGLLKLDRAELDRSSS